VLINTCIGVLNDLFKFDTVALQWSELNSSRVSGPFPSPRLAAGILAASGRLYVLAGAYPLNTSTMTALHYTCEWDFHSDDINMIFNSIQYPRMPFVSLCSF
jgi:hypothetical protein